MQRNGGWYRVDRMPQDVKVADESDIATVIRQLALKTAFRRG